MGETVHTGHHYTEVIMFISTQSSAKLLANGMISVVIMTALFAGLLAYGPDVIRGVWSAVVALFAGLL